MKKYLSSLVILIVLYLNSNSQIVFEEGYFINQTGERVDCYIKNIDWKNNPEQFEFKITLKDSACVAGIQTIKEFGIKGVSRYVRANVMMDLSSDNLNSLSTSRNPVYKEDTLFLKVLVEGKASLYLFENKEYKRFFYQLNDSSITQLIYKRFMYKTRYLGENNYFRTQLKYILPCEGLDPKKTDNMSYTRKNLVAYFKQYNECSNSGYINYDSKPNQDLFNLSIRPGINYNSLEIWNSVNGWNTDFGNRYSFRIGAEAEIILPFNKNKWGVIFEPTLQYFKTEKTMKFSGVSGGVLHSIVNYESIELPFGIRHYFFINEYSKLFVNASFVTDFCMHSTVDLDRKDGSELDNLTLKSGRNLACGIGYKFRDKYSIEMRYYTKRTVLDSYIFWGSEYKNVSLIFGYNLF